MNRMRTLAVVAALITLLAACGGDDDEPEGGPTTTTAPVTTATTSTTTSTSTTSTTTTATQPAAPAQPALWPAADSVLATPEEAAQGFVRDALGVPPVLGEFRAGDPASGEIDVFSPGEGGAGAGVVRSTLLLRRLGSGWFVIGAVNEHATIEAPTSGAEVDAGPVTVSGRGRGFEGTLVVTAMRQGSAEPLDQEVTQGGAMADALPYSVELDLSGAATGDVVVLLVQGGTGLEDDPGEVGAIPVKMAG